MSETAHQTDMPEHPTAKILVVDDEPDLAELIRQKFRRQVRRGEFEFLFAGDGQEALDLIRENPDTDLVLTDINMPRMDGLTLLSELSEIKAVGGAVVVTAYGDMMNIRVAMNQGAFDFLTKPIDLDDLEVTVKKAVEMVRAQKEAAHAKQTVGRYLSDEVAEALLSSPEATKLGGERRRITILMSDLRGFSAMSEELPPERVVEVLNVYLGTMAEVIGEYGGTIDEYLGDGILVLFGAPVEREDHARRAVACAIAMQGAMERVNERISELGLPRLQMGIGINTGDVVVGNIGSEKRTKYGVVGSPVNMTGRIEGSTVGGQILVAAATREEAGDDVKVRRTLELAAKGFSEPIPLYEVVGIGAPYDLHLDIDAHPLIPLDQPVSVHFRLLDGKEVADDSNRGTLVAASEHTAVLQADYPFDLLADIKLSLNDYPDHAAYAKVFEATGGGWVVHFTALPEEVADVLRAAQTSAEA